MAVDDLNVIDMVGTTTENIITLTISDHLDWTNIEEHLFLLQSKLNTYIQYIESGDLYQNFASGKDKSVAIRIYFKNEPKDKLIFSFLEQVSNKLNEINIALEITCMS